MNMENIRETRVEVNLDVPKDWNNERIQNFVRMALNARVNTLQLNRGKVGLPAYALKVQGVIVVSE